MLNLKESYDVVSFNLEVIMRLSKDAYDFCDLWKNYLHANGWTEEEFEAAAEAEVFSPKEVN